MTIIEAEDLLREIRTRDDAAACGLLAEWDEAYQIAFGAYMAERNFEVAR